jgi:hypothetical protein
MISAYLMKYIGKEMCVYTPFNIFMANCLLQQRML